jgi:hypothetical protein
MGEGQGSVPELSSTDCNQFAGIETSEQAGARLAKLFEDLLSKEETEELVEYFF